MSRLLGNLPPFLLLALLGVSVHSLRLKSGVVLRSPSGSYVNLFVLSK